MVCHAQYFYQKVFDYGKALNTIIKVFTIITIVDAVANAILGESFVFDQALSGIACLVWGLATDAMQKYGKTALLQIFGAQVRHLPPIRMDRLLLLA